MQKWVVKLAVATSISGITAATINIDNSSDTASAATWHKGTPKAIRGHYKRGNEMFTITSKEYQYGRPDWAATWMSSTKYKKSGNAYYIIGTYHNGGSLTEKNSQMKITTKKNHVGFKFSWSSSFHYLGWFHK